MNLGFPMPILFKHFEKTGEEKLRFGLYRDISQPF